MDATSPAVGSAHAAPSVGPSAGLRAVLLEQHTARLKQQEASTLSCGAQHKVEQQHTLCVCASVCVCVHAHVRACVCETQAFPPMGPAQTRFPSFL